MNEYKLGVQVSIAGGYLNVFSRIEKIGGNCLQMFSSSPRDWKEPQISEDVIKQFMALKKELGIDPIYFHANYLINLAAVGVNTELSIKYLISELNLASKLGIKGSVVHVGSFVDGKTQIKPNLTRERYNSLFHNIWEILSSTPEDSLFIIENSGSRKIGLTLEEIGFIINNLHHERVKVCLDTAHLHAAGYELSTKEKLDTFVQEFDKKIGLERLELFHLNDSKANFGTFVDRHENIGEGHVEIKVFRNLLQHPYLRTKPFILETPGFDGNGPDRENLDIVRKIVKSTDL